MATTSRSKWGTRLGTLVIWGLAGSSLAYWGLRWASQPAGLPVAPAVSAAPAGGAADAQALARALGAGGPLVPSAAPAAAVSSRFALLGVLSGRQSGGGAALISVDGQPPKPVRLGQPVDGALWLVGLGPREAQLGPSAQGPATVTLEVPRRP